MNPGTAAAAQSSPQGGKDLAGPQLENPRTWRSRVHCNLGGNVDRHHDQASRNPQTQFIILQRMGFVTSWAWECLIWCGLDLLYPNVLLFLGAATCFKYQSALTSCAQCQISEGLVHGLRPILLQQSCIQTECEGIVRLYCDSGFNTEN